MANEVIELEGMMEYLTALFEHVVCRCVRGFCNTFKTSSSLDTGRPALISFHLPDLHFPGGFLSHLCVPAAQQFTRYHTELQFYGLCVQHYTRESDYMVGVKDCDFAFWGHVPSWIARCLLAVSLPKSRGNFIIFNDI